MNNMTEKIMHEVLQKYGAHVERLILESEGRLRVQMRDLEGRLRGEINGLRGEMRDLGRRVGRLEQRVGRLERRVDRRLERIEGNLNGIRARQDAHERRFKRISRDAVS